MSKNWSLAYTTTLDYRAQMIKDLLKDHDVEVAIINKKDSAYVLVGEIEIYVLHEKLITAKHLIKSFLENEKSD